MRLSPKLSPKRIRLKSKEKLAPLADRFETMGGVFATSAMLGSIANGIAEDADTSSENLRVGEGTNESGEELWSSSGAAGHHVDSPRFRRRSDLVEDGTLSLGDDEVFSRVMIRSRMKLPDSSTGIASFHVLVNEERTKKGIAPLARNRALDDFAREQAQEMATSLRLSHSDPVAMQDAFGRQCSRLGENAVRGSNVAEIHDAMRGSMSDFNNVLDRRFTSMGVGTTKGEDGKLYVCQVFRG